MYYISVREIELNVKNIGDIAIFILTFYYVAFCRVTCSTIYEAYHKTYRAAEVARNPGYIAMLVTGV